MGRSDQTLACRSRSFYAFSFFLVNYRAFDSFDFPSPLRACLVVIPILSLRNHLSPAGIFPTRIVAKVKDTNLVWTLSFVRACGASFEDQVSRMTAGVQPEDRPLDAILADLRSRSVSPSAPLVSISHAAPRLQIRRGPLQSCERALQLRTLHFPPFAVSSAHFLATLSFTDHRLWDNVQILSSSRSLSAEAFNKVYSEINSRCFALVNSNDLQDKLAGVTAIGQSLLPTPSPMTEDED